LQLCTCSCETWARGNRQVSLSIRGRWKQGEFASQECGKLSLEQAVGGAVWGVGAGSRRRAVFYSQLVQVAGVGTREVVNNTAVQLDDWPEALQVVQPCGARTFVW